VIRRSVVICAFLASPAWADISVQLTEIDCPYAARDVPKDVTATCSRMTWREEKIDFKTTVAVLTPDEGTRDVPIIYIPGGPGDAPVNEGGDVASILALFPDRTLITLNPRGVQGSDPKPSCEFAPDFWDEDLSPEREAEIVSECRDDVTLDLVKFDAPYLAQDISRMVDALEIKKAAVFSISYGTESALHLLASEAAWLGDRRIRKLVRLGKAIR